MQGVQGSRPQWYCEVNFFGSSHLKSLPKPLRKIRSEHPWCLPFKAQTFDAKGGRTIGSEEVESIKRMIKRAIGPTAIVLIIGSNQLRDSGDPTLVTGEFRQVLQYGEGFGHVHIVVVSIIPSVRKDARMRFAKTSAMLRELTKQFKNSSFLNMSPFLCPKGKIVKKYFCSTALLPNGREKNVHLNTKYGAPLLARSILCHISRLAKNQLIEFNELAEHCSEKPAKLD